MSAGGDGEYDTRPTYTHDTKPPHTKPDHGSTTTFPTPTQFTVNVTSICTDDNLPGIVINFPTNAALAGQSGVLDFSDGTSYGQLVYRSGGSITIPYPSSRQSPLTLTYRIQGQTATATVTLPPDCPPATTTTGATTTAASTSTTSTTINGVTTTIAVTTTTVNGTTTTSTTISPPGTTTTTVRPVTPPITGPADAPFAFGAATTACRAEVPVIVITFQNRFPELAGRTGVLTMSDVNGNVVSTQNLVYQPGTTVEILYPGTVVNPDGSIDDVPGWILQDNGLWVRDPSDEFLREGINLSYTVNPTATAFVTYPPESSTCANPENPPAPVQPPSVPGGIPITE
jgi:hypothetical protein